VLGFDSGSLNSRYAFIDECPESVVDEVITLTNGSLTDRVAGVLRWRDALLKGLLPAVDNGWPLPSVGRPVLESLRQLGVARFCRDQQDLVDALLKDIIQAFRRQSDLRSAEVSRRLRELEDLERRRRVDAAQRKRQRRRAKNLDEVTLEHLRRQAQHETDSQELPADAELVKSWSARVRAWSEIADVFGDLGNMLGRGWDLSLGVLRQTGWLELVRLRKLIEQLDSLRAIIRALGRLHAANDGDSIAERLFVPVQRLEEELLEVRTPIAPTETRGIDRSGSIARMLPVEAMMLGHPTLRMLWHAKRAERTLLSYRVEGVIAERVEVEREHQEEQERNRPRPERGPIIAIIDTSGSMHGLPEQVAKAVVLEAMRTAHSEQRRCFLFAYSGPGQVIHHELDLTTAGIGKLLSFLGLSFHGGNDEAGMLPRVLNMLHAEGWERVDVLFVSDGEWPTPSQVIAEVEGARERGTRFHGVQIGNRGRTGLHAVCDPVHQFSDWGAMAGWEDWCADESRGGIADERAVRARTSDPERGPESCAADCEVGGEALTGEHAGRVLSRRITSIPGRRRNQSMRKAGPRAPQSPGAQRGPVRSETPCMHVDSTYGNREIHWLTETGVAVRAGNPRGAILR